MKHEGGGRRDRAQYEQRDAGRGEQNREQREGKERPDEVARARQHSESTVERADWFRDSGNFLVRRLRAYRQVAYSGIGSRSGSKNRARASCEKSLSEL